MPLPVFPRPHSLLPHGSSLLAAVLLSFSVCASGAPAEAPASANSLLRGCADEMREYTRAPTPEVLALWAAANAGREDEFMRLLPEVGSLADHAVEGRPLLTALLSPLPSGTSQQVYWEMEPALAERLLSDHQQRLPAKARMLAAALERGAGVGDVTPRAPYPPLHLAMVFGSPEMVRLLLAAGAQVDCRDTREHRTALEFLLDQEYFVRMTYLPPLVSRAQRGEMVVLLVQAGAQRPYLMTDELSKREGRKEGQRPAADYLAWDPLLTLTEGAAPVLALLATGTRPADDGRGDQPTALALAAATGNAGAVEVLKPLAPATLAARDGGMNGRVPWSPQLDAALAAAATGHLALAKSMVEPGMPLGQRGPQHLAGKSVAFEPLGGVKEGTLLHFAVRAGDADWVRELVARGAPLESPSETPAPGPLAEAMAARQPAMVDLLLQLGANPLLDSYWAPAPLLSAMEAGDVARVKDMLSRIHTPERRRQLAALSSKIVLAWAGSAVFNTPQQSPAMRQWLDAAGFEPRQVNAGAISEAIAMTATEMVRSLIEAGAPVELDPADERFGSPLAVAIHKGDSSLVAFLVAHGAKVDRWDGEHMLPIQLALLKGEISVVKTLLRAKASFDFSAEPHGSAFDLAVASGRLELVDLVAEVSDRQLRDACLNQPAAADALLRHEKFFDALLARGLNVHAVCNGQPNLLTRLYDSLIRRNALPWLGEQRESLARLFAKIDGTGGAGLRIGEKGVHSPLQEAIVAHRPDAVGILLDSGASAASRGRVDEAPAWLAVRHRQPELLHALLAHGASLSDPGVDGLSLGDHVRCRESESFRRAAALALPRKAACPVAAPMNGKEKALARQLAGHYVLSGMHEVGSEILLHADGKFEYALAYGNLDETSQGSWRVRGRRVSFSSPPGEAGTPMRLLGSSREEAKAGTAVRFRVQGRALAGLVVLLTDTHRQEVRKYEPNESDDFLRVPEVSGADALAWRHPDVDDGHWRVVELPRGPAGERLNRFDFELDPALMASGPGFNLTMDIEGRALLMKRSGRTLRYERE